MRPHAIGLPWMSGDRLVVRATRCTVASAERIRDCEALRLLPHSLPDAPFGTLLVPFDRPRRITSSPRLRAVRPRRWLHGLRRAAARQHPFGSLRHAAAAAIEILPYQLEPALAMLRHAWLRVLLADAVGLGKTIQAGLVLAEVLDASATRRALVIVPAGLRHQWSSELAARFGIDAAVSDADWLRRRGRDLPPDTNPWALPGTYVVSMDFIKQPEVLQPLEDLLWDVVIVDEAHLVTTGTDRRAAVGAVAARARRVMLLTGTPHSGDEAQFDALCRIGEGPARTPLVIFNRRASDVGRPVARRSTMLRVRLSDAERRMHEMLDRYTSRLWRESHARGDRAARLVPLVLRKRALSSAGSLAASLARRVALLSGTDHDAPRQLALPLATREDTLDDEVRDDVLAAPGLANAALERRWLSTLLELARRAATDERKIARLRRYLSTVDEPAIVFTEYRDTLARLRRALDRHALPVLTLHGGMPDVDRRAVQRTFNEENCVLLATDAAAEGLNLQHRCRIVVHFELPWNPLRLEQRTGRIDRIGQRRRVHEVALAADDTAERFVLAPLARRARRAMGIAPGGNRMLELLSELDVAEAVFAGRDVAVEPRTHVAFLERRFADEAAAEASRIAEERRYRRSIRVGAGRDEPRPLVTTLRARRRAVTRGLTLVYTLSFDTGDGRSVHADSLVLSFTTTIPAYAARWRWSAARHVDEALTHAHAAIAQIVEQRFAAIRERVLPAHRAQVLALRQREAAIAKLENSAARELVQAGLFDRRAVRGAEMRQATDRLRREDAHEQLMALTLADSLTPRVTLEAALIRCGHGS